MHGDLKPSNILVAEYTEQNTMHVTLADFGFSRHGKTEDSFVQLTRSEPWDAPEWTHGRISLSDAKKMDMYSLGLLCLWLFFGNETLDFWDLPAATVHAAFTRQDGQAFEEIQYRKRSGNHILMFAETLIENNATYSQEAKHGLRKIFALTLIEDPDKRHGSIEDIIRVLSDISETS